MGAVMRGFFSVLFIVWGLTCLGAIAGLYETWGLGGFFGFLAAVLTVVFVPPIAPFFAAMGAHADFGWEWPAAIALGFWPLGVTIVAMVVAPLFGVRRTASGGGGR